MTSLEHGFAVIENCYPQADCAHIGLQLDKITGAGSRCLLKNQWCQTLAVSLKDRAVSTIPELQSLVPIQCTFFNKSSSSNWFVAFHQDRSIPVGAGVSENKWPGWSRKEGMTFIHGPDKLLAQMVALRLHIDDSAPDNGPLRVIPDSHRSGTLSLEDINVLRDSSVDQQLTVDKGGVVAMRPLLLHASPKSRTMDSRRVLHFLFGPPSLPEGLEWRQIVSAE